MTVVLWVLFFAWAILVTLGAAAGIVALYAIREALIENQKERQRRHASTRY